MMMTLKKFFSLSEFILEPINTRSIVSIYTPGIKTLFPSLFNGVVLMIELPQFISIISLEKINEDDSNQ